jgi:hypothetical protein
MTCRCCPYLVPFEIPDGDADLWGNGRQFQTDDGGKHERLDRLGAVEPIWPFKLGPCGRDSGTARSARKLFPLVEAYPRGFTSREARTMWELSQSSTLAHLLRAEGLGLIFKSARGTEWRVPPQRLPVPWDSRALELLGAGLGAISGCGLRRRAVEEARERKRAKQRLAYEAALAIQAAENDLRTARAWLAHIRVVWRRAIREQIREIRLYGGGLDHTGIRKQTVLKVMLSNWRTALWAAVARVRRHEAAARDRA